MAAVLAKEIVLSEKDVKRFLAIFDTIKKGSGCWLWPKSAPNSYGRFHVEGKGSYKASRIAYYLFVEKSLLPSDLVLHSCDNPPCVRPFHLRKGTHKQNQQDCVVKGRKRVAVGDRHWSRRHPELVASGARHGTRTRPDRIARGEQRGMNGLKAAQVLEIRQLYGQENHLSQHQLARKFGVTAMTINRALRRQTWSHI